MTEYRAVIVIEYLLSQDNLIQGTASNQRKSIRATNNAPKRQKFKLLCQILICTIVFKQLRQRIHQPEHKHDPRQEDDFWEAV